MSRIERLVNATTRRPDPDQMVSRHQYQRDPQSGAGNCWCGRHEGHRMHQWSDPRDERSDGATSVTLNPDTRRALQRASRMKHQWHDKRDTLIIQAAQEGASLREIAEAAGMSHTSIVHIINRKR